MPTIYTVDDVARKLNLKQKPSGEWYGSNPWGEGAEEDGFILWPEGNATDRKAGNYTTPQVAEMAGIDKKEYEPYIRYMESQSSKTDSAPKSRGKSATKTAAPPKVYNGKTLEQRGVRPECINTFKITFKNGAYYYPTFTAEGKLGRGRVKYLDPVFSFPNRKNPPKYIWQTGDKASQPAGYNLDKLNGQKHVWLVNGEPSVWVCHQARIPSTAPFGEGRNKGYMNLFAELNEVGIEKVYVCLDNDETGHQGSLRAREAATEFDMECVIKLLPNKGNGFDVGDFYLECDCDDEMFRKALQTLPVASEGTLEEWRKKDVEEFEQKEAKADEEKEKKGKQGIVGQLIEMAMEGSTMVCGRDGSFYLRNEGVDAVHIRQINDDDLGMYLRYRAAKELGIYLSRENITDSVETMKANAFYEGSKEEIFVRTGHDPHSNSLFLDLCDDEGKVVEVTSDGSWFITRKPSVTFRRAPGMEALPEPIGGGNLDTLLRPLFNCADDMQWVKLVSWLVYALRGPLAPYPVLSVHGGRGSAKSTMCKLARSIIDPNFTPFIGTSGVDERNVYITAKNSYIMAFDNMTGMSGWLNDTLCSLATEGSFRHRQLQTDDKEMMFKARRPIIVNGIEEGIGREDFRNRCIPIYLSPIDEKKRMDDITIQNILLDRLPYILGALLDILAVGHANVLTTTIEQGPRMMDFARFMVAAEPACPWRSGTFLPLIMETSQEVDAVAAESNIVAVVIEEIMKRHDILRCTPTALLTTLNQNAKAEYKQTKQWPHLPSQVVGQLARIEANLKAKGILVSGISARERSKGDGQIVIRKEGYNAPSG